MEWISVNDDLPEDGRNVLVWAAGDDFSFFMSVAYVDDTFVNYGMAPVHNLVTHWCIPTNPNQSPVNVNQ